MVRPRYCSIQSCVNFKGTTDPKLQFFRAPFEKQFADKWMEEISKYQVVRRISLICKLHFEPSSFTIRKQAVRLKYDAIPTIFLPTELSKCDTGEPEAILKEEPISIEDGSNKPNGGGVRLVDIGQIIKNSTEEVELRNIPNDTQTTVKKIDSFCHGCLNRDVQIQGLTVKVNELKQQIANSNELIKHWKQIATKRGHIEPLGHTQTSQPPPKLSRMDNFVDCDCEVGHSLESEPQPEPKPEPTTTVNKTKPKGMSLKLFKCALCDEDFEVAIDLKKHLETLCRKKPKKKVFECFVCKKVANTVYNLQKHIQTHKTYEICTICSKSIDSNDIENNHKCDQMENIQCEYCTESFASTKILLKHLVNEHGNRTKYGCIKCGRCFGMNLLKEIHERHHKSRKRSFFCSLCSKPYLTKPGLALHEESCRAHATKEGSSENIILVMRHLCEICGKAFRLKESLTVHMLIHNDSTFKCPNCPKLFRTKQSLKEHSNIHNNVKHACTFCDHESSSPKALRKHMNYLHLGKKPIFNGQCQICLRLFTERNRFNVHVRNHSIMERAFNCDYCPQTYKYKSDLIKHLRTHLGEEVYKCEECPRRFKFSIELRKHSYEHYKEQQMNDKKD